MQWLVTTKDDIDLAALDEKLAAWKSERLIDLPPVPLGDDELVFEVIGPKDLPQRASIDPSILEVYPNPDMDLF